MDLKKAWNDPAALKARLEELKPGYMVCFRFRDTYNSAQRRLQAARRAKVSRETQVE